MPCCQDMPIGGHELKPRDKVTSCNKHSCRDAFTCLADKGPRLLFNRWAKGSTDNLPGGNLNGHGCSITVGLKCDSILSGLVPSASQDWQTVDTVNRGFKFIQRSG